ncbi:hypothetical protein ACQY0O_001562 [Thecaphora frezii]
MAVQDIPPVDVRRASSGAPPHEDEADDGRISPTQTSVTKTAAVTRPPTLRSAQTMHEPRLLQQHYPPQPFSAPCPADFEAGFPPVDGLRAPITIRPSGRPGFNAPKAATFFLGKDHERWRRYDRDHMGLGLAWGRVASAVSSRSDNRGSRGARSALSDTDDDLSDGGASAFSGRSGRSRSSRHSHSQGQGPSSRRPSDTFSPPLTPVDGMPSKTRRFSTNGSEASFMRHETVIGLHTPRRQSASSSDGRPSLRPLAQIRPATGSPSSLAAISAKEVQAKAGRDKSRRSEQERSEERALRNAEKERHRELSKKKAKHQVHETLDFGEAARPSLRRLRSNLEEAAAAAAASMDEDSLLDADAAADDFGGVEVLSSSLSEAALGGRVLISPANLVARTESADLVVPPQPQRRTASPRAPPLKLAPRRKPELVEGTLYDKSGPHREGAVTDGLSVRLFSCEESQRPNEDADLANPEKPVTRTWGRRTSSSSIDDDEGAVFKRSSKRPQSADGPNPKKASTNPGNADDAGQAAEEDGDASYHASKPQVYLITTPDNRVSSAAKLRRWAMDGEGRFYAAMEIKSVEAKLRAADPSVGPATRELARELKETYLEDILDEVQKAETLNPTRTGAVSKVLKTEDGRYVRLEEDYPEEAFFVIAGCEEAELYPVLSLIFTQAIRTLAGFHAAGWMHGDIKLENLMFDETGQLVVIDYENANPYRGIPGGDGTVQLVSYDWIPPEASPGPLGRWMGPSGDLWALGCNLIRAFALRDGIEDLAIREMLLGEGQNRFLEFVAKLVTSQSQPAASEEPPSAYEIDMEPIFADAAEESQSQSQSQSPEAPSGFPPVGDEGVIRDREGSCDGASTGSSSYRTEHSASMDGSQCSTAASSTGATSVGGGSATAASSAIGGMDSTAPLPTPSRLLYRFARSAPQLLRFVLTRCVTRDTRPRGAAAEVEGLRLAAWFEKHQPELLEAGRRAVAEAIEMSGSTWVRPRLDEARRSLGLE